MTTNQPGSTIRGNEHPLPKLDRGALPGLYRAASDASNNSQKSHFFWLRSYLLLLIATALPSFFLPNGSLGAALSAALFITSLLVLIFLKVRNLQDIWYNGRAVAESVKTRTWRWVMQATPYEEGTTQNVDKLFIDDLLEILKDNKSLSEHLSVGSDSRQPISQRMRDIRALSTQKRLKLYVEQRIDSQARWYRNKALSNKHKANFWFWVSVALHTSAVVVLLAKAAKPSINLPTEALATAAGAVLTWLEAKRHRELTSSYALTANEINIIQGRANYINSESDLANFVLDSENAFSREHTQWSAKKSV